MKWVAFTIAGFFLGLLSETLFSFAGFWILLLLYCGIVYALFFLPSPRPAFFLLGGLTLCVELYGSSRFGMATFLAVFLVLLYDIFKERLRFTSLSTRYIVALLMAFIGYTNFLYSYRLFGSLWLPLLIVFIVVASLSALSFLMRKQPAYEIS